MSLRKRRNLVLLAILHFILLASFLPGCKEGTKSSPVSALLTGLEQTQPTIDLADSSDAVHTIVGSVVSQNTGEKLANVTVKLFLESQLAGTTKTTSDGQFYFSKIPPGIYDLSFTTTAGDYKTAVYVVRILEDGTMSPASPEVKLAATNPEQIKVQAKIEGEVLVSGTGTKLANVNVELEDGSGNLISTALTGAAGQFSFTNLGTGTYNIKAGKASIYVETQQIVTIRDDGVVSPRYSIISLTTKPIESFSITGFVKNQNTNTLANLEVKIFDDPELRIASAQPTRTTGEGKFFFENLKDAKIYFLQVSAGTNSSQSEAYPVRVLADGTTSPTIAEIFVTRDESVQMTNVFGKIYDAFTGGPLEYVTVKIAGNNVSITDKSGIFTASDMIPGTYKIELSKFGYETLTSSFQVQEDGSTIPASLSYPLLHNMKTGYGSIVGRLVDETTGEGIQNLTVRLFEWVQVTKTGLKYIIGPDGLPTGETKEVSETDWQWKPNVLLTSKTSSAADTSNPDLVGSFKLTHLEPGHYIVYIASGYTVPTTVSESRGGYFTWDVPNKGPGFKAEIRDLVVEAGNTTYWTNYEQTHE